MPDNFNAHDKAMQLELMAKELIHNPDENSATFKKFSGEVHELFKDNKKMIAVGEELQKMESDLFSTLPNAIVMHDEAGNVQDITFKSSYWDKKADSLVGVGSNREYSDIFGQRTPEQKASETERSRKDFELDAWRVFYLPEFRFASP